MAVPDAIIHKPGRLDDSEWDLMRQHTLVGERVLGAALQLLDRVLDGQWLSVGPL